MLTTSARPPASGTVKMKMFCEGLGQTQVYIIKRDLCTVGSVKPFTEDDSKFIKFVICLLLTFEL